MRLTREEIDFVVWSSERLSEALGFYSLDELEHRTRNHLASLKILMSYYRRVRTLVDFVRREKAAFPVDTDQSS